MTVRSITGACVSPRIDLRSGYHQLSSQRGRYNEDGLEPIWALRVHSHAIWADKRTSNIHGLNEPQEEHEVHLETILDLLKKEKYTPIFKCLVWLKEVQFLGHVVNRDEIYQEFLKVCKAPTPVDQKNKTLCGGGVLTREEDFRIHEGEAYEIAPVLALLDGTQTTLWSIVMHPKLGLSALPSLVTMMSIFNVRSRFSDYGSIELHPVSALKMNMEASFFTPFIFDSFLILQPLQLLTEISWTRNLVGLFSI
ncbi:hypothetical protein Tco_0078795 [Tanacetum coccineum]